MRMHFARSTARSRGISGPDLYFKSAEKSQGEIQFYWVALAAFVVKDIVHAYEYTRDRVLSGAWRGNAGDTFEGVPNFV